MGRSKNTSFQVRQLVVFHREKGKSLGEVAKLLRLSWATVQSIVKRFNWKGRLSLGESTGRPRLLEEHDERKIIWKVKKNPKTSAPKLTTDFNSINQRQVCVETVRKVLCRHGYNGRVACQKPLITKVNRKKRLKFAREYMNKPPEYWNDVIFYDEREFNLFSSDGRVIVWRQLNTELER